MKRTLITLSLPLVCLATACSSGDGPAAPSPLPPVAPATGGATITGSITGLPGGGDSGPTSAAPSATPTTVTIVGTTITATVDAKGLFTLTNVPGGTLQLQITGPGFSGIITVEHVTAGETIELSLSVLGPTVSLMSERRSEGNEEQLEGRVEALPPATDEGTLIVAGRTVVIDSETQFVKGGMPATLDDIAIGQRVHIKGQPDGDRLRARLIDIQNDQVGAPVNLNGIVSALSVGAEGFQFMVDGRLVMGDALTEFYGGSVSTDLADDVRVTVKGEQRNGYVYAKRIHVNGDDDEEEAELSGVITSIAPLVVGGTTIETTPATEVRRRGDLLPLDILQVGMTVEVTGTLQPGGSVLAKKITIGDSTFDVDVDGDIAGLTGSCPAIQFTIGALAFVTSDRTEFKKTSCAALTDGSTVKIRGVLRPDGTTVEVTRLERTN